MLSEQLPVGRIEKLSDGGPAFPPQDRVLVTNGRFDADELRRLKDALAHAQQTGMTLRDYFAAMALSALLEKLKVGESVDGSDTYLSYAAECAYKAADAMLKARER